ncbi:hypothetical protein POM88_051755 [Heracleum sosnowskyi]|uniref:Uncharacterized protein n=1 Tax=Heracleum sosnowskyi TaxID=360622 RepID=A0AAD8H2G8_9APIA|nr:hypothetical protein POM88_051755 [Heracleum sosnowskyi]
MPISRGVSAKHLLANYFTVHNHNHNMTKREPGDAECFRAACIGATLVMVFFLILVLELPLIVGLLILVMVALIVAFTYKPAEEKEIFKNLSAQADSNYIYNERLLQHYPDAERHYYGIRRDFEIKLNEHCWLWWFSANSWLRLL